MSRTPLVQCNVRETSRTPSNRKYESRVHFEEYNRSAYPYIRTSKHIASMRCPSQQAYESTYTHDSLSKSLSNHCTKPGATKLSSTRFQTKKDPLVSRLDLSDLQDEDDDFSGTFTKLNQSNTYGTISKDTGGQKTELVMSLRQTNVLLSPRVYDTVVLGEPGQEVSGLETTNGWNNGTFRKPHLQQVTLGPVESDTICDIMLSPRENGNLYGVNDHPTGIKYNIDVSTVKHCEREHRSCNNRSMRKNQLTKSNEHQSNFSNKPRSTSMQPRTSHSGDTMLKSKPYTKSAFSHSTPMSNTRIKAMSVLSHRKFPPSNKAASAVKDHSKMPHRTSHTGINGNLRHGRQGSGDHSVMSSMSSSHLHMRESNIGLFGRESLHSRACGDSFFGSQELAKDLTEADIEHLLTQQLLKNIDEKCKAEDIFSSDIQLSKKHTYYSCLPHMHSDLPASKNTSESLQLSDLESELEIGHTRDVHYPQYYASSSDASRNNNTRKSTLHSDRFHLFTGPTKKDKHALNETDLHNTQPDFTYMSSTCSNSQFSRYKQEANKMDDHTNSPETHQYNESYNDQGLPTMNYNTSSLGSLRQQDDLHNISSLGSRNVQKTGLATRADDFPVTIPKQVHFKEPLSASADTSTDHTGSEFSPFLTLQDLGIDEVASSVGSSGNHDKSPQITGGTSDDDTKSYCDLDSNISCTVEDTNTVTGQDTSTNTYVASKQTNHFTQSPSNLQVDIPIIPSSNKIHTQTSGVAKSFNEPYSHLPQTSKSFLDHGNPPKSSKSYQNNFHPPKGCTYSQNILHSSKAALPLTSKSSKPILIKPLFYTSNKKPQSHPLQAGKVSPNKVSTKAQEIGNCFERADVTLRPNADADTETLRAERLQRIVEQSPPKEQQNIVLKARYFRRWHRNVRVKKLVKSKWNFKWMKACSYNNISTMTHHFIAWRQYIVNCRIAADKFHRQHSLKKGLHALVWSVQYRCMKIERVRLSQRRLKFNHYFTIWKKRYSKRRLDALRSKFSHWRIRCRNKVIVNIFENRRNRLSLLQIFFFWNERYRESANLRKAVQHCNMVALRKLWHLWRIYTAERIVESSQAEVAQLKQESWVLSSCMSRWKKAIIQTQYSRLCYNKKIVTTCMKQWKNENSLLCVQHHKENASAFELRRTHLVRAHFMRWKEEIKVKRVRQQRKESCMRHSFIIWRSQLSKQRILSAEISALHQKHLLKQAFAVIKMYSKYKKDDRRKAVTHIERFTLARSLSGWHQFTMRKVKLRNMQKTFSFNSMKTRIRRLFYIWCTKLSLMLELQQKQREWTELCVRSAADKWLLVLQRKKQVKLCVKVVAEKKKLLLRGCFLSWKLHLAREQKSKERAKCYKIRLLRGKLRRVMRSWHLYTQSMMTAKPLVERMNRKKATKFFDAWKLLLIRRDQREMMRRTVQTGSIRRYFVNWREKLNTRLKLLGAKEIFETKLRLKVIQSWKKILYRRHSYHIVSEQHEMCLLKTSFETWSKKTSLKRIAVMSEMEEYHIVQETAKELLLRWRNMSLNAKTRELDKVINFKQGRDLITKRSKFNSWKNALRHHKVANNFNSMKTRQRLKALLLQWNSLSHENLENETLKFSSSMKKLTNKSLSFSKSTQSNATYYSDVLTQTHDIHTPVQVRRSIQTDICTEKDTKSILDTNSTSKKYTQRTQRSYDGSSLSSHHYTSSEEDREIDSQHESGMTIGGDSGVSLFRDYVSMATSVDLNEGVKGSTVHNDGQNGQSFSLDGIQINRIDQEFHGSPLEPSISSHSEQNLSCGALSLKDLQNSCPINEQNFKENFQKLSDSVVSCKTSVTHMHKSEKLPITDDPFLQPVLQQFSHMSSLPVHDIIVPKHIILQHRETQNISHIQGQLKQVQLNQEDVECPIMSQIHAALPEELHKSSDGFIKPSETFYTGPYNGSHNRDFVPYSITARETRAGIDTGGFCTKENKLIGGTEYIGPPSYNVCNTETLTSETTYIDEQLCIPQDDDIVHSYPKDGKSTATKTDSTEYEKDANLQSSNTILCFIPQSSSDLSSPSHPHVNTSSFPPGSILPVTSNIHPDSEEDIQEHLNFNINQNMHQKMCYIQEDIHTGKHASHLTQSILHTSSVCGTSSHGDDDIMTQTDDVISSSDDVIWELPYEKQKPRLPINASFRDSGMSQTEWLVRLAVVRMRYRPLAFSFHQWKMLIHVKKWETEMLHHMKERSELLKLKMTFRFWKMRFFHMKTAMVHQQTSLTQKYFRKWLFGISRKLYFRKMKDVALRFSTSSIQKKFFWDWKNQMEKRKALLEILSYWQTKANDRSLQIDRERKKLEKNDSALLHDCFIIWSLRHKQSRMAEHHFKSRELNKIFLIWFDWSTEQKQLQDHLERIHNHSLKKQIFAEWKHSLAIAKRMNTIKRRFLRLWVSNLIARWRNYAEEQQRYASEISRFASESYVKSKQNCFEKWKEEWTKKKLSGVMYRRCCMRKCVRGWRDVTIELVEERRRFEVVENLVGSHIRRSVFAIWKKDTLMHVKIRKRIYAKSVLLVKDTWNAWRARFNMKKAIGLQSALLERRVFLAWRKNTEGQKALNQKARILVMKWHQITVRNQTLSCMADQFRMNARSISMEIGFNMWLIAYEQSQQANLHHNKLILQRCFTSLYFWTKHKCLLEKAKNQFINQKRKELFASSWYKWKYSHKLRICNSNAIQAHQRAVSHRLLQRSWLLWKQRLRELRASKNHDANILLKAFNTWNEKHKNRIKADRLMKLRQDKRLKQILKRWRQLLVKKRNENKVVDNIQKSRQNIVTLAIFGTWLKGTRNVITAKSQCKRMTMQKTLMRLKIWSRQSKSCNNAVKTLSKLNLRIFFTRWRRAYRKTRMLEVTCDHLLTVKKQTLLKKLWKWWFKHKEKRDLVKMRERNLATDAVNKWRAFSSNRVRKRELEKERNIASRLFRHRWICTRFFTKWKQELMINQFISTHETRKLRKTWSKWTRNTGINVLAVNLNEERTLRKFWDTWRIEHVTKKAANEITEQSKHDQLRHIFKIWRSFTNRRKMGGTLLLRKELEAEMTGRKQSKIPRLRK